MSGSTARGRLIRRRIRITGWTALSSLLVTVVGFLVYFHIVFPADRERTLEVYRDDSLTISQVEGSIVMNPSGETPTRGILFFPGARVDPYSYLYPLSSLASGGTTVVIMDPLMNMALFDQRPLSELISPAPSVTQWTLAGHSLGGVRACMLADDSTVSGLILFASFCANDLGSAQLDVLLLQGDQDGLIDTAAVLDSLTVLPTDRFEITTIAGANHADFGTYGVQPGDGDSVLSDEEMRVTLTTLIESWWEDRQD